MNRALKNRSVKILPFNSVENYGTGILLDSHHILTCAHVVRDVCQDIDNISAETPIRFSPMGSKPGQEGEAYIVHAGFMLIEPGFDRLDIPSYSGDFQEAIDSKLDFLEDLILLKSKEPINNIQTKIEWRQLHDDDRFTVEGYGYHIEAGDVLSGITQGERHYKIHQIQFENTVSHAPSFSGASGTALLAKDSHVDEIIGYGLLFAEPQNTTNSTDFAYFIPGDAVKQFLAEYRAVQLNPSPASIKKNYMPQSMDVQKTKFTPELASSLIDRQFLDDVESDLNDNGVVFMVLSGEQQDWFAGINMRLINGKELSLDSAGLAQKKAFQKSFVDWPGHENGKNINGRKSPTFLLKKMFPRVLSDFSMHSYASAESNEVQEQDALFNAFHSAIENCERVVIGIKLQQSMLHTAEKLAIERLIDELKQYFKDGKRLDNEVQILCYLVIDSTLQNSKHKIAQLWDKLTSLKMHSIANILRELSSTNKFCYEDIQTLQKIELSHLSNWETQLESCGLGEEKIELLKYHAKQIINPQQGIRHSHFMRELDSTLHS